MTKIYVTKTLIEDSYEFSELDFDLHNEFDFDYEEHDDFEIIEDKYGRADAFPVNIDKMIAELNKLKEKGSTHVQIDYHCDHIGYDISGFEIRKSTEEEKIKFDKNYKKEQEKQEKIRDLYNQINEIKNK